MDGGRIRGLGDLLGNVSQLSDNVYLASPEKHLAGVGIEEGVVR